MTIARVAILSDHALGAGGGERYTFALVRALLERWPVDFLVGGEAFRPDPDFFRTAFGWDIEHPRLTFRPTSSVDEIRGYDLFVNVSHFRVLPPLARRNLFVTFFPQLLSESIPRYDAVLTISRYSAEWIRKYWGLAGALVVYPSIDLDQWSAGSRKEKLILSVGRFFDVKDGNVKNHGLMIRAFKTLCERGLRGFRLVLAGGTSPEHAGYVEKLRQEAAGHPIEIRVTPPFAELSDLYARAAIYWHAAGLTAAGLTAVPSAAEHFGITILEAMASGAVPIVAHAGGAAEIVTPGETGFRCTSPLDLVEQTLAVARDEGTLARVGEAARRRASDFAFEKFAARVHEVVDLLDSSREARGDFLLREGDFEGAAEQYSEAIDRFPDGASAYFALAECFFRLGRRELMLAAMRRGLEIEPGHPAAGRVRALAERVERQRSSIAAVRSGRLFDEDYFERGTATGLSHYEAEQVDTWSPRHAAAIDGAFHPSSCLEVGSAKGELVRELRARGVRTIGTDLSFYSLGRARPEVKGRALAAASAAALPFGTSSFDVVVSIELLEHLPPELVTRTLSEIWRVARHFVFMTVQNTTAAGAEQFFADLSHTTMKPLAWWQDAFRRAGFELIPTELPLAEFVGHQIVARPLGKYRNASPEAIEACWRGYDSDARALMSEERWDHALRHLEQAMRALEHAEEETQPVAALRSRTYLQLARCYLALGREAEAQGSMALAR